MRKRLIGKAFAIAMSGAMVLTATPVTANIFNVAQIVKAADEKSDDYVYCYAGLTWAEYWASEDVYNADKTDSSTELDSHGETDKGGYDVVSRATTNHGIHRGSFQCTTTIYTTDGNSYQISSWEQIDNNNDGKYDETYLHLKDIDGRVTFSKGVLTLPDNTTKTMDHYEVSGIKYVPVKVKVSDYEDFKAKYSVVENNDSLVGGYSENNLNSFSLTANVTANTNGLKEATKNSDGTFSFAARSTGTDSGVSDELKKATKIEPTVKEASGSYGEFLRVDLNGDYGDLGSKMQAVKWTYYGNDSTRTKALATYGTKFAADNWMHKSMGIQLGLTDSIRCQLPANTDGTGYWSLTVYALGYEDYTVDFEATNKNIVGAPQDASDEEKSSLQNLVTEAESLKTSDYCKSTDKDTAFANLQAETAETKELLAKSGLLSSEVTEQTTHLTEAINAVKALKKHDIETITTPATTTAEGSVVEKCKNCGEVLSTKTIAKLATTTAKATTTTVKAPAKTTVKLSKAKKTSLKVTWKKVSGVAAYQIQYGTSKSFKKAKTVKVSAKSTSKVLKKLKKNKKYYVRVRSCKVTKVNNKSKNVYSAWSAKKALKTKKK